MEDAENLILSQIRNLKAIFKDFSDAKKTIIYQLHVLKAMFKNFSAEDDEEYINIIQNLVLGIAADIISLLREHNERMQTQRKEWWQAQGNGIIDEFKTHKILVKAAVKRANENLKDSTSNSLSSQESNALEVARDKEKKTLSKIKGLEEGATENNDKEFQEMNDNVVETENCEGFEKVKGDVEVVEYKDKMEEIDNTVLLTDDENKLDVKHDVDQALAKVEDYEIVEVVKGDQDKVQFSDIRRIVENCDKPKETEDIRLFKYDNKLGDTRFIFYKNRHFSAQPQTYS